MIAAFLLHPVHFRGMAVDRLNALSTREFGVGAPRFSRGVDLAPIRYPWRGRQLSGSIALPRGGAPKGLVIWCHGTISDDRQVPSRAPMGGSGGQGAATLALCSAGYAVASPDYPGQGDDRPFAFHPYPLAAINGSASAAIVDAARTVLPGYRMGPEIRVSGYSEGGAVALWTSKFLEQRGLVPAATAALSGPYDLAGVQARDLVRDEKDIVWRIARAYLLAYAGLSAARNSGIPLESLFTPSFARFVPTVFDDQSIDEEARITAIGKKTLSLGALISIRKLLKPELVRALREGDGSHPVLALFREHAIVDWMPSRPTLLVANRGDRLVFEGNADVALANARSRGEGPDRVRVVKLKGVDHLTGQSPSVLLAARFFDRGFAATEKE